MLHSTCFVAAFGGAGKTDAVVLCCVCVQDMEAVVWLENYLAAHKKILLMVSHSQDFLNNVCTNIITVQSQKIVSYAGNYDTVHQ